MKTDNQCRYRRMGVINNYNIAYINFASHNYDK